MKRKSAIKTTTLLALTGTLASLTAGRAADTPPKPTPPALTAEDKKKAETEYLVPSPGDLFGALQHSGNIDWKALSALIDRSETAGKTTYADDILKALNMGMRVADAFVAVEAHSKDQFKKSSSAVETLATQLSAGATLKAKREQAMKLAEEGKWPELGNLLESIRFDVLQDFKAVPDEDAIILANLGGWLRGLDLVSGELDSHYTAEGTKVLRQAGLINFLLSRLSKLGAQASSNPSVTLLKAKLPEIVAACTFDQAGTLPPEKVRKLHELTSALVQALQK